MTKEEFQTLVSQTIDAKIIELISTKPDEPCINYTDSQSISLVVKNIFIKPLRVCPKEIEAVCNLSEAVLAPTKLEKIKKIKATVGLVGGVSGIGMIIGSVGVALGWGTSVIAGVTTFFSGVGLFGPIGLAVSGVSIVAIASYFTFSSDKATNHEKYVLTLKSSLSVAIDKIWDEHGKSVVSGISLTSSD